MFWDDYWGDEIERLAKLQIDNSLDLGWNINDIKVVTNFKWNYGGVESIVLNTDTLFSYASSKINVINYLFENKLIENDTYWYHDFDAFQLEKLDVNVGDGNLGLCEYGPTRRDGRQSHRLQMGSFFFDRHTEDIFKAIGDKQRDNSTYDEDAISLISKTLKRRIVKLNNTFNFGLRKRNIKAQYDLTETPIKVIHFHPYDKKPVFYMNGQTPLEVAYGNSEIEKPLITDRFSRLLTKHGLSNDKKKMKGEIIYVSSNRESKKVEDRIIKNLLSVTDLPIISVTQKPTKLGRNIVVGDVGVSGFNMFRQILIGLKESDADYVIGAESDCLYPPDYFEFIPPDLRTVYRSKNTYILPFKEGCFYPKPVGSTLCQVIGRKYYIEILEALFESAPKWTTGELSFPKERRGHHDIVLKEYIKHFSHTNPIISLKTGKGMRKHSNGQGEDVCELPYWGSADTVREKYESVAGNMKNLMVYVSKDKKFDKDTEKFVRIQIDNSLDFWKPKDIILATNFPFKYKGIESLIVPDNLCGKDPRSNKIAVITYLLCNQLLPNATIWYHDFDAYQDDVIDVETELGFTGYGWSSDINLGSFFFKPCNKAKLTFGLLNSEILRNGKTDERTLKHLIANNQISDYRVLNIKYNYGQRLHNWPEYDNVKPKVLHFHPILKNRSIPDQNLDIFMYGNNRLNKPLMSKRLIRIFKKHKIVKTNE